MLRVGEFVATAITCYAGCPRGRPTGISWWFSGAGVEAASVGRRSAASESIADNELVASDVAGGDAMEGDRITVIRKREDSDDEAPAQSTGKIDLQASGWTKRIRVGSHPPCPGLVGALEQTIRGHAEELGAHVTRPGALELSLGLAMDSRGEAYDFCTCQPENFISLRFWQFLLSWEEIHQLYL